MITNSIYSFIRSMQMPFDSMSKAGRIVVAVLFLIAGVGSLYVGLTTKFPVIIAGAVLLCFISIILSLPGHKRR